MTPWTLTHQAPLSVGVCRQEYWSGLPCPPPGDLPNPGIELLSLMSPALTGGFFTIGFTWESEEDRKRRLSRDPLLVLPSIFPSIRVFPVNQFFTPGGQSIGASSMPLTPTPVFLGFPGGSYSKESACNAGDLGLIPGLGRSPGGGHGNPLQYSCLENPHRQRSLAGYSPWGRKE